MPDPYDEAIWRAWRRGKNPDNVSRDRISQDRAMGYEDEETIERELERIGRNGQKEERTNRYPQAQRNV